MRGLAMLMEHMGCMEEAERLYRQELRAAKGLVDEVTLASVENLERFLKD